jgi:hypothetical protein
VPELSVPSTGGVPKVTLEPDTAIEDGCLIAWDAAPSTVSEIEDLIACVMSAEAGLAARNVRHDTKRKRLIWA